MAARLGTKRVVADRWQFAMLAERLASRGLSVSQITSDPANLDKWATLLKRVFAERVIRIPNHTGLIERLKSWKAKRCGAAIGCDSRRPVIIGTMRRSPCVCPPRTSRAMSARCSWRTMSCCALEYNGLGIATARYLAGGMYIPMGEPLCKHCAGHRSTVVARDRFAEPTGQHMDLRDFVREGLIRPNAFYEWTSSASRDGASRTALI